MDAFYSIAVARQKVLAWYIGGVPVVVKVTTRVGSLRAFVDEILRSRKL